MAPTWADLEAGKHTELLARAYGRVSDLCVLSKRLIVFSVLRAGSSIRESGQAHGLSDGSSAAVQADGSAGAIIPDYPSSCRVLVKDRDGYFTAATIARIAEHLALCSGPEPPAGPSSEGESRGVWAVVEGFPEIELGSAPGAPSSLILHCARLELRVRNAQGSAHIGSAGDGSPREDETIVTFMPDTPGPATASAAASGATQQQPPQARKRPRGISAPEVGEEEEEGGRDAGCAQDSLSTLGEPSAPRAAAHAKGKGRTKPRKEQRHQHFVAWLCETYGEELLRGSRGHARPHGRSEGGGGSQGSCGVLDIAGGAGGVAFELSIRRGIGCVVVDPRSVRCAAKQRSALRVQAQGKMAISGSAPAGLAAAATGSAGGPVAGNGHGKGGSAGADVGWAAGAHEQLGDHGGGLDRDFNYGDSGPAPQPTEFSAVAAEEGAAPGVLPLQLRELFGVSFSRAHAGLLASCSILVGMHPDEATEAIVDLAVAARKPFALLPCCVFPSRFHSRRLPDGREVRTHADLCEYLVLKARRGYAAAAAAAAGQGAPAAGGEHVSCLDVENTGDALDASPAAAESGTAVEDGCAVAKSGFTVSAVTLEGFEGRNVVVFSLPS